MRLIRDGHCFTSMQRTVKTVRDGEPRTATSTFTQLLSSEVFGIFVSFLLFVHRGHKDCLGLGAISTFTQLSFEGLGIFVSVLLYVHRDHKDF